MTTEARPIRPIEGHWMGGRLTLPIYIMEDRPGRPELVVWYDAEAKKIVAFDLADPARADESFVETLVAAMSRPLFGAPRRPAVLDVESERVAELLRPRITEGTEIRVRSQDLMGALFAELEDALLEKLPVPIPSYLEGGTLEMGAVEALFASAARVFRAVPWSDARPDRWIGMEASGPEGFTVALSISDPTDHFRSIRIRPVGPAGLEARLLAVHFFGGRDLHPALRKEIARHAFEVAGPEAYPMFAWRDPDGVTAPLTGLDVRRLSLCLSALARFFEELGRLAVTSSLTLPPRVFSMQEEAGTPLVRIGVLEAGLIRP